MKKILVMVLALVMALSLAACGGSGNNDPKPSGNDTPGTSQQDSDAPLTRNDGKDDNTTSDVPGQGGISGDIGNSSDEKDPPIGTITENTWLDNEYFDQIPKTDMYFVPTETGDGYTLTFFSVEKEAILAYVEELKEQGFTENESIIDEGDYYQFNADNEAGYSVMVSFNSGGAGLTIHKY